MSFKKIAISDSSKMSIEPLNHPKGWDIFELPKVIKTASVVKDKGTDLGGFNLESAIEKNPEHLFMKIFAIKEDEVNDNGDCFSAEELKKAADSFVGVPIFTNHQNDDVEKSRGDCVHAWYDEDAKGIFIIARVDKTAYPQLARGIEEGYVKGTSMGCFPGHMRVTMSDGSLKPIKDIRKGDRVITALGRPKKVLNIQNHLDRSTDDLINIKAEGLPKTIEATPNHEFLVVKEQSNCVVTGDFIGTPAAGYDRFKPRMKSGAYQNPKYELLKEQGAFDKYDFEWKSAGELTTSDVVVFPKSNIEVPHDDASISNAKLIGYFLSEGSYMSYKGRHTGIEFNLSIEEEETLGSEIENLLLEKWGHLNQQVCTYNRTNEGRNSYVIRLNSTEAAKWFEHYCGNYSHLKRLPEECLYWPKGIQAHILGSWINGDGMMRQVKYQNGKIYKNNNATTTSETMFYQMRFIATRLGLYSGCTEVVERAKKRGRKPYWTLTFGSHESTKLSSFLTDKKVVDGSYRSRECRQFGNYIGYPIRSLKRVPHIGAVFDIEVEDDHSYLVEGVAVHNCSVEHSTCSICHNLAHTADDYCVHVRERKNRKISGRYTCKYHESSSKPEGECPVCGSTKDNVKTLDHKEQKAFEHNFGLKFIENSFVVNPACHTCGVTCVLNSPEVNKKIAQLKESTKKLISTNEARMKAAKTDSTIKVAGRTELELLSSALTDMEKVAKSMFSQKDHVDLEYVSDLVKVMSDLQDNIDELTEMGYAQLPSPPDVMSQSPTEDAVVSEGVDSTFPTAAPTQMPQNPQSQQGGGGGGGTDQSDVLDGLGTITAPKTSSVINKKKEFIKTSGNLMKKLDNLQSSVRKLLEKRREQMSDVFVDVWEDSKDINSRHVIVDNEYVTEAQGDKVLKVASISTLPEQWQDLAKSDPEKLAKQILTTNLKESDSAMVNKNEKTAAIGPRDDEGSRKQQHEMIQEKQMDQSPPVLHPRQGESYQQITESEDQIGRSDDKSNDTTSESPQKRRGTYETVTEDQLDKISDGHIVRWKDAPDIITEKQWDDMSRLVSAKLPGDWLETITQDQIRSLLDNHATVGTYETITQDQFNNQDWGVKRWANKSYVNNLLKASTAAMADTIAKYHRTPQEISSVIAKIADSDKYRNKVSWLTVVNSLPHKNEARKTLANNVSYFQKKAAKSIETPDAVDALILSVAENSLPGLRVEDIYETIGQALRRKEAMAKVDKLVQTKLASDKQEDNVVDKWAMLDSAMEALDNKFSIYGKVSEIEADPKNKKAFAAACKKFAAKQIEAQGFDVPEGLSVLKISVDPETGTLNIETGDEEGLAGGLDDALNSIPEIVDPLDEGGLDEGLDGCGLDEDLDLEDEDYDDFEDEDGPPLDIDDNSADETNDMSPMKGGEPTSSPLMGDAVRNLGRAKPMANPAMTPSMASSKKTTKRAQAREKLVREAQMMGGEMGGQGGAAQAPGAGGAVPGAPTGDIPPMENMTAPGEGEFDNMDEDINGDLSPKPPGSTCPVCTSDDVDLIAGKGKCNNCGSEMTFKVAVEVTKWSGLVGDEDNDADSEGEGFELPEPGEEAGAEEFDTGGSEMPVGAAAVDKFIKEASNNGGIPFALMTQLKTDAIKIASKQNIKLGSVSPVTGSTNTMKLSGKGVEGEYVCLDSGYKYNLDIRIASNDPKKVYAQWSWTPKIASESCDSCSRARNRLLKALANSGISEDRFNNMSIAQKSSAINKVKKAGSFDLVKLASKTGSVVADFKKAFGTFGDNFPIESCREKLARRYGENSLAMSGPCEGEPIHECVCNQLKNAGVYTTGLANKVANTWLDKDGTEECVEEQIINRKMNLREAAFVCSALKTALASDVDLFADELGEESFDSSGDDDPTDPNPFGSDEGEGSGMDVDPFDGGESVHGGTVTLELPEELAKALDFALDEQLGSDPTDDLGPEDGVGDVEVIGDEPETIDEGGRDDLFQDGPSESLVEDTAKPMESANKSCKPCSAESDEHNHGREEGFSRDNPVEDEEGEFKEGNPDCHASSDEYKYKEAKSMKSSLGNTGRVEMDLSSVAAAINKKAGEKVINKELVQDSSDIGNYSAGDPLGESHNSAMGHENESVPTAKKPSVPRSDGRIGHEDDNIDKEEPLPNIPSDKGTIGHEDEVGLEGGDTRFTGGTGTGGSPGAGQSEVEKGSSTKTQLEKEAEQQEEDYRQMRAMSGHVLNSKERTNSLAERILEAGKLSKSEPVADDKDIQPHSTGKGIGHEPDFSAEETDNNEGSGNESMMGHESESLGDRPTSPDDHPDFPSDNATMGHEEDGEIGPEKQEKNKGTVIAGSDEESEARKQKYAKSESEAFRVAGRLLEAGVIESNQLQKKIAELREYGPGQIRDYEKAVFSKIASTKKGLNAGSDGIERPVVIREASSQRNAADDLVTKLSSLFTLDKQNKAFEDVPDSELRNIFR